MKSLAMVLNNFNTPLEFCEVQIPKLSDGEVLLKLAAAGVCGSDIHIISGEDDRTPLPLIPGHEGIGTVFDKCGDVYDVDGRKLNPGDAVLFNRGVSCGVCYECTIGKKYLCKNRKVYGINIPFSAPPHLNGCYAEYVILRKGTEIISVDEPRPELVSVSCSGATAAHGFIESAFLPGQTAVIQGPGAIGCYLAAFLKKAGAKRIIAIGGSGGRLELISGFGATELINRRNTTHAERIGRITELTDGRGADVVFEACGAPGSVSEGLDCLCRGGRYVSLGFSQESGLEQIDMYRQVVAKNVTINGVWVSDISHLKAAYELSKSGLPLSKLVEYFPLERANEAIDAMRNKQILKAVLINK